MYIHKKNEYMYIVYFNQMKNWFKMTLKQLTINSQVPEDCYGYDDISDVYF